MKEDEVCHAEPPVQYGHPATPGPNYGLPHVPVLAKYDNKPCFSCVFCGCWIGDIK